MPILKVGKGFGKQLRKLRKAAGLTQAALGKQCGVHPVSIAQYETGVCNPSEKTAVRLRVYFEGLPDRPDLPALAPIKKKRGRPKKVIVPLGTKKDAEQLTDQVLAVVKEPVRPRSENMVIKSPVRLGQVSLAWIEQQVDSYVHARGMTFVDGQTCVIIMCRRDLIDLAKTMLGMCGTGVEELPL